jgi:hypothetical protein
MLFREFHIIAAAAFSAQMAADQTSSQWDDLTENDQNLQMQRVMSIARQDIAEEEASDWPVFTATAAAILGYNKGQGGLALEELANLGRAPFELELVQEQDVAGRNIREVVVELLAELAERRKQPSGTLGIAGDNLWQNPRYRALQYASQCGGDVAIAQVFASFITNADGEVCYEATEALSIAIEAHKQKPALLYGTALADRIVTQASDYVRFMNPAPVEAEQNGESVLDAPEPATVQ